MRGRENRVGFKLFCDGSSNENNLSEPIKCVVVMRIK